MKGGGVFEAAFERKPIENNREGNEPHEDGAMLELKELFHRKIGEIHRP